MELPLALQLALLSKLVLSLSKFFIDTARIKFQYGSRLTIGDYQ
jgi:hypothetical protein